MNFIRRLFAATIGFVVAFLLSIVILLLPTVDLRAALAFGDWELQAHAFSRFWPTLTYYLSQLARGQILIAPDGVPPAQYVLHGMEPANLGHELMVTVVVLGAGTLLALPLGLLGGFLLSRFNSVKLVRRGLWASNILLGGKPEVFVVAFVQLLLLTLQWRGILNIPVTGVPRSILTWKHLIAPVIVLALIPLPYLARLVAVGLEEAGDQLYVRTAMAKGLPRHQVVWGHIFRSALGYYWPALPVVMGLVLSAGPLVEYLMSVPGLGAQVIRAHAGYRAALYLAPVLALTSLAYFLADAGATWINPVPRQDDLRESLPWRRRLRIWRAELSVRNWLSGVGNAGADLLTWARDVAVSLPGAPRRAVRTLVSNGPLLAGTVIIGGLALVAIFADQLAPYHWTRVERLRFIPGDVVVPPYAPSSKNLLGTDEWGRDNFSALIWGARVVIITVCAVLPLRFLMAIPLGVIAGFRGGTLAWLLRQTVVVTSGLPAYLLPLVMVMPINSAYRQEPMTAAIIALVLIALPGIPKLADAIRLHTVDLLTQPYVEGARAAGAGPVRIFLRHLWPHLAPRLATLGALEAPPLLSVTTFLALVGIYIGGVIRSDDPRIYSPYMPEWGWMMGIPMRMLRAAAWWQLAPLGALLLTVAGFSLLAEGFRRQTGSKNRLTDL